MISIRKYLDKTEPAPGPRPVPASPNSGDLLEAALEALRVALIQMGHSGVDACAATGVALEHKLAGTAGALTGDMDSRGLESAGQVVQSELQSWGRATAAHYREKAAEVKELLLLMAKTAESVGDRDERCAQQIGKVTAQLRTIASLDDLTVVRRSIEASAAELKTSMDRIAAEGRALLDRLKVEVKTFQTRLEEAEEQAYSDPLTGLRNRAWVESQMEQRMEVGAHFCVALLDLDGFKNVNDKFGHMVGDELLKQYAAELRSACRSSDIVGRWGGDEFVVLLDGEMARARAQMERVSAWVCGSYVLQGVRSPSRLRVEFSIGISEYTPPESIKEMMHRADKAMYEQKLAGRAGLDAVRWSVSRLCTRDR